MSCKYVQIRKICDGCGREFITQIRSTMYCSRTCNSSTYKANLRLQTKQKVEKETDEYIKNKPIQDFKERDFLKCTQVAKLMGV
jgi:hypothetical protein